MSDTRILSRPYIIGSTNTSFVVPAVAAGQTTTWDPSNKGADIVLTSYSSQSNLTASNSNTGTTHTWETVLCTSPNSYSTGKYYAEYLILTHPFNVQHMVLGFCQNNQNLNNFLTSQGDAGVARWSNPNPLASGIVSVNAANLPTYTADTNDRLAIAIDITGGQAWIGYAASGAGSVTWGGTPGVSNPAFTWTPAGTWFLAISFDMADENNNLYSVALLTATLNLGYSPPSGFSAWG